MQIASLGHVVIRVRDLQRAEAFYRGLLRRGYDCVRLPRRPASIVVPHLVDHFYWAKALVSETRGAAGAIAAAPDRARRVRARVPPLSTGLRSVRLVLPRVAPNRPASVRRLAQHVEIAS
jgi:catechol 2,3-dioxygenase-like lactoylglutathione lyase family enzyme